MIPKKLHVVWVGPHRPPQEMIDSWEKKHVNGWFYKLWTDPTGWINQKQIDVRAARNRWNGVADVMRYEILHKYGGFAVDADSECLMALDEGPEDFLSLEMAVACYENETVRPGIIGCGFLGAPKEHPFFQACIDDVAKQSTDEQEWKAVGPGVMGRVAAKMPDAIKVFPAKMFNPEHFSGVKAPGNHPVYARQGWGSTKGYGALRKLPCTCPQCWTTALRPPWG